MIEEDPLPEWAHEQVDATRKKIIQFNKKLESYNQETVERDKAKILGEALSLLAELESIARRYKYFTKSSGLVDARNLLNSEVTELESKGISVPIIQSTALINVLFVDTETTGLDHEDQPISIGAVLSEVDINTGAICREVSAYYGLRDPSCEISPAALRIHGLSKAKLAGMEFDIRQLVCMFGVADLIVAHNSKFDRGMLRFFDNESRSWACSCWDVDWPKDIGGRSLDVICAHFSIDRMSPHNAISDTRAMMAVLQKTNDSGSTYLSNLLGKFGHVN